MAMYDTAEYWLEIRQHAQEALKLLEKKEPEQAEEPTKEKPKRAISLKDI